jgi:hypothetical protein
MALSIGGIEVVRWIGLKLEAKYKKFPLMLHYYTWYYLLCLGLCMTALHSMYYDIMSISGWLDPEIAEKLAKQSIALDDDSPGNFTLWRSEASLEGYGFLRWFSLLSPVWVLLTWVVSVVHTYKHVVKIREVGQGLKGSPRRDKTLRIIGLPLCYGLMSFKSVMRMWQVSIDHVGQLSGPSAEHIFHGYEDRKNFLVEMYEANFMVGDIYESYALAIFGQLLVQLLDRSLFQDHLKQSVRKLTESSTTSEGGSFQKSLQSLNLSFSKMTVAGINLFFYSCLISAVYQLLITTMGMAGIMPSLFDRETGAFQTKSMKADTKMFFLGAGFVASFAAIGNIMLVERSFHHVLDEHRGQEFRPAPKFWGTKVLVTLAFIQSIVFGVVFSNWSEIRVDLLYASCLTFECLLISLLHYFAWHADEKWYVYHEAYEEDSKQEPMLG